jgi:hypothetical protein
MAINVSLKGAELAEHLARTLTDLEFELLLRARITMLFHDMHVRDPNLSESYNNCSFHMSWGDEAKWNVGVGENYSKSADISGQVLSNCVSDVYQLYLMKQGNRLSKLLPAPSEDEDKKW